MKPSIRVVNDVDRAKMVLAEQGIEVEGNTAVQIVGELAERIRALRRTALELSVKLEQVYAGKVEKQ